MSPRRGYRQSEEHIRKRIEARWGRERSEGYRFKSRMDIPRKEVSSPSIETAIRSLFCVLLLSHQNVDDIKSELELQFSGKAIDEAISDMVRKGILERVSPGNYRMML